MTSSDQPLLPMLADESAGSSSGTADNGSTRSNELSKKQMVSSAGIR